jgi:hypothetical protein
VPAASPWALPGDLGLPVVDDQVRSVQLNDHLRAGALVVVLAVCVITTSCPLGAGPAVAGAASSPAAAPSAQDVAYLQAAHQCRFDLGRSITADR